METEICIKCQKCCKEVDVPTYAHKTSTEIDKIKAFYEARGFTTYFDMYGFLHVELYYPCPHITEKGCDIYENRPEVCRNYDGRRDPRIDCDLKNFQRGGSDGHES